MRGVLAPFNEKRSHAQLVDARRLPREQRTVRCASRSGDWPLDFDAGAANLPNKAVDRGGVKSPTDECEVGVTDGGLTRRRRLLSCRRRKDFEITTVSQGHERILCASPRMFAATLGGDASLGFELSHAAFQIVDSKDHMVNSNASACLHRERTEQAGQRGGQRDQGSADVTKTSHSRTGINDSILIRGGGGLTVVAHRRASTEPIQHASQRQ